MNSRVQEGWLRSALFTVALNIYFLVSIFICNSAFRWDMKQGLYFVFGIFSLFSISLLCTPKRQLKNPWLGLLVLVSLVSVFSNSFYFSNTIKDFINFSLMCEGFIYVLCGVLLYKLIYEYGKADLRYYPVLWIALLVWLIKELNFTSTADSIWSILGAIAIGMFIWVFYYKRFVLFFFAALITITAIVQYRYYIWLKSTVRIDAWKEAFSLIRLNPLGTGFQNILNANTVYVCPESTAMGAAGGRVYINNDILSVTKDLGVIATFVVFMLILHLFKNIKIDKLVILCIMVLAYSCVKTTWYFPSLAVMFIPLYSLMEARKNV